MADLGEARMPAAPRRVLVTGATGFVGRAVCAALAEAGIPFVAAVRRPCAGMPQARVVGEISRETDWTGVLEGVDTVIHLAARVHLMRDTAADPLAAYREVNTQGTLNLARQAAAAGVRRFVFASSVKVNGEGRAVPYRADDVPAPVGAYALSKLEAERGLLALAGGAEAGMTVAIVRLPLVYGPGVGANFRRLMDLLRRGVPLPFGRVENRRSLVFVGNAADLMIRCLTHPAAGNRVWMVSDGEDLSTPALLRKVGVALGCPARLLPVPQGWLEAALRALGKGDFAQRLLGSLAVDIAGTRSALGWTPLFSVDDGMRMTAASYLSSRTGRKRVEGG
mgnify:CR=1 FL=1